jgi:hypothetical protein
LRTFGRWLPFGGFSDLVDMRAKIVCQKYHRRKGDPNFRMYQILQCQIKCRPQGTNMIVLPFVATNISSLRDY